MPFADLPGMVVGIAGRDGAGEPRANVIRGAANVWWLSVGQSVRTAQVTSELAPTSLPSEALLHAARARRGSATAPATTEVVAKVELDICGAWVTMANAGPARPVAVRRAGWVDVRGHPSESLGGSVGYVAADDRVGLGPGDVLVFRSSNSKSDDTEDILGAALAAAGQHPTTVAQAIGDSMRASDSVIAVGVPHELGDDPRQRVAEVTGQAVEELQSPGYPLADLQPDLWREPPMPPRLARLRLSDAHTVSAVRSLLDRLLASWRLTGRVDDDDVKLVATELTANAVVHSREPDAVTVRYTGDVVRVEVTDLSPELPQLKAPTPDGLGGRGLHLVDALVSAWGAEPLPPGKRVWCELPVSVAG